MNMNKPMQASWLDDVSRILFATLLILGVAAGAACTSSTSTASPTGETVIVDDYVDIPAAKVEQVPAAPSGDYVWVRGAWEREPGKWTWVQGRWEKPPHQKAHWQEGHWNWIDGRWHWSRGHWAAGENVVTTEYLPVPELKSEVITAEPSARHVWVPGYWERNSGDWEWVQGHWEKPPDKAAHWSSGHWNWQDGQWHWARGHWATADKGWIVDRAIDIPAAVPEKKPPKPSDKNHWVAGYWEWDGHWTWIPGYWTELPDPKANWVAGHWDPYGSDGEWRWIAGHWEVS